MILWHSYSSIMNDPTPNFEADYFAASPPYLYRTGCYLGSSRGSICSRSKQKDATLRALLFLNTMLALTSIDTLILDTLSNPPSS